MQAPKLEKKAKSFEGWTEYYSHASKSTKTQMSFAVIRPAKAHSAKVPVLYWLSGLTCTEENFVAKAGAQQFAAQHGFVVVAPDTSPRGLNLPGEDDSWDFGTGAGFYVNATQSPWSENYRMFDYVTEELPSLVQEFFPVQADRASIFGHSMGGHGALIAALRYPDRYKSVSAFAPISSPSQVPWGTKAFGGYLGSDPAQWTDYDANALVQKATQHVPMLIDQGSDDNFLKEQLRPELFLEACKAADYPLQYQLREGYDHSYYFIASFMESHFAFHAKHL